MFSDSKMIVSMSHRFGEISNLFYFCLHATALQFYDNAYLRRLGQNTA